MDIGLALTIGGILIAVAIWRHQERSPSVDVQCFPSPEGDPTSIKCRIRNRGRGETRDIRLCFNNMLPLETEVLARPDVGARIEPADLPPDPGRLPAAAKLQTAFSVVISRVAPNDEVEVTVRTSHPDNVRAGDQLLRIQTEMFAAVQAFGDCLKALYKDPPHGWEYDLIVNGHCKQENFFSPGSFVYERGRFPIEWLTEEESLGLAIHQDYYSRHKRDCIEVFQGRPEFKAPVGF